MNQRIIPCSNTYHTNKQDQMQKWEGKRSVQPRPERIPHLKWIFGSRDYDLRLQLNYNNRFAVFDVFL